MLLLIVEVSLSVVESLSVKIFWRDDSYVAAVTWQISLRIIGVELKCFSCCNWLIQPPKTVGWCAYVTVESTYDEQYKSH